MKPPIQRILVRGVNWLGDAIMSLPALARLREAFPAARISLLTPEKLAGLWPGHPAVDEAIPFAPSESLLQVSRRLRAGNFDAALIFPNSIRSALEIRLAGIPRRISYGGGGRGWLLTEAVARRTGFQKMRKRSEAEIRRLISGNPPPAQPVPPEAHHTAHYLHLAAALGCNPVPLPPQLFVSETEAGEARNRFQIPGGRLLLGLNPGAEYGPAKRWPLENFIAAAREVQETAPCLWLLFGGKADQKLTAEIASQLGAGAAIDLAGRTSLRELCALLKSCRLLLTNDTGPMHVAAAVGAPVVVPFGSTSPELTGPGLPGSTSHILIKANVPCSPCFLRECPIDFRCLRGIAVGQVVAAIRKALASS